MTIHSGKLSNATSLGIYDIWPEALLTYSFYTSLPSFYDGLTVPYGQGPTNATPLFSDDLPTRRLRRSQPAGDVEGVGIFTPADPVCRPSSLRNIHAGGPGERKSGSGFEPPASESHDTVRSSGDGVLAEEQEEAETVLAQVQAAILIFDRPLDSLRHGGGTGGSVCLTECLFLHRRLAFRGLDAVACRRGAAAPAEQPAQQQRSE